MRPPSLDVQIARRRPGSLSRRGFAVFLVLVGIAMAWPTLPHAIAREPLPVADTTSGAVARAARPTSIPNDPGSPDMSNSDSSPRVPGFSRPRADLLTGGQPDPADWERLRRAGVTMVVNLRTHDEMAGRDTAAEARAAGLSHVSLPIDGGDDVTAENARALWTQLGASDGVTLVHCASGNRVGALLALGAAQAGAMSPEEALDFGRSAGLASLEERVRALLGLTSPQ
jgi:uncharacterized protein (TIGR01244 family)